MHISKKLSDWLNQPDKLNRCFLVYIVLLIFQSIVPLGSSLRLDQISVLDFRADHLVHVALFIPWAFFCIKLNKYLPICFCWGLLVASASELVQYVLPYRSFNISDMLANIIGVAAGFLFFVPFLKGKIKGSVDSG